MFVGLSVSWTKALLKWLVLDGKKLYLLQEFLVLMALQLLSEETVCVTGWEWSAATAPALL